jgi:DNA-binding response OmpR family regulator
MEAETAIAPEERQPEEPRRPVALVAESDETDRKTLAALCRDRGFEVVQATDAESAVETAHAVRPDLILLDVGLPAGGGLAVLARLRDQHPVTPVVMVSEAGEEREIVEALDLGAANYVKKPVQGEEMRFVLDQIRRAIGEESDHRRVLRLVSERQTRLSFPGDPTVIPTIVGYLGREVRTHYPGWRIPLADLKLALYEALANAVEHGNLEIDYEMKTVAMATPGGMETLVKQRLADPHFGAKSVHVRIHYRPASIEYRIRDEGRGFDPQRYDERHALANTTALHGRGLALIRHFMTHVAWNDAGNEIRMTRHLARHRAG